MQASAGVKRFTCGGEATPGVAGCWSRFGDWIVAPAERSEPGAFRGFLGAVWFLVFLLALASPARANDLLSSRENFFQPRLGKRLPAELEFTDSDGKKVHLGDFNERPFILVLAYYRCPRLCTETLNDLVAGLKPVPFDPGKDFDVVVVSFDPDEKPELAAAKKASYVEAYESNGRTGTEGGWHFLTGDQPNISRLMDATGFKAVWDERQKQFAHARGIMVVSPKLLLTRYFMGGVYAPRDLRMALVESSQGRIFAPMDRILMMCFKYDPDEGKYSVAILNLVRAGAVLTLLLLGGFWLASAWWRRTGPAPAQPPVEQGERP
jgi:protein SCO1/2